MYLSGTGRSFVNAFKINNSFQDKNKNKRFHYVHPTFVCSNNTVTHNLKHHSETPPNIQNQSKMLKMGKKWEMKGFAEGILLFWVGL